MIKQYLWNILVSLDQFLNVLLSPILNNLDVTIKFGNPDETLSSVFGKNLRNHPNGCTTCKLICKFLDIFDHNHCLKNIEDDE